MWLVRALWSFTCHSARSCSPALSAFMGPGPNSRATQHPRGSGALCVHGPRAEPPGTDTLLWLSALSSVQRLPCRTVVPGRGSVGDASLLDREKRFLRELRRPGGH